MHLFFTFLYLIIFDALEMKFYITFINCVIIHVYVLILRLQIKQIIKEGIMVPDAENELRKQQLRELALLNGTLRENDALS